MIDLYNTATNELVGNITEHELQYLTDNLEEESIRDTDYYFDMATVDMLGSDGLATDHLLKLLRDAIGNNEGVELRWERRA
ncbi:MAG: galactosyldiacylglycerol synthase [Gemmatimonadaceae bacterium]